MQPIELKPGDACPACGGELVPARHDGAGADVRAELGTLYACRDCRYKTRFRVVAAPDAAAGGGDEKRGADVIL